MPLKTGGNLQNISLAALVLLLYLEKLPTKEEDNQTPQKTGSSALFALMLEHSTIKNYHLLSHSIPILPVAYTKRATALPGDYGCENRVRKLSSSFYPSQITGQPYHELSLA